ncbi:hypothetical protein V5799_031217 [Amblyomma americanum]|uniref:Peptidase M13 C-terminal domain-containing protein n=1 Tax=Amblyomma americanum TaxID=6943 RepID=A0AAQ4EL40_AMBAM
MHHNDEDAEWINVQHRDNSEENLENSYSKDLTFYDECLDSAELAKRIILAESTVQEFIPAIRQTSHHPIHTTVGSIGRFTPCAASEDVPQSALASTRRLTRDLTEVLKATINGADWIQGEARSVMFDKAKHLLFTVGFPDGLDRGSQVESFYAAFPDVDETFFDPYLESRRLLTTRQFRGNITANFRATDVNAVYSPQEHNVNIFAALLQPPFFFNNGPASMNYGGLGQVISQEIMHAYDAAGMNTNYLNQRVDLRGTPTMKAYAEKVTCLRSSYEKVRTHISLLRNAA